MKNTNCLAGMECPMCKGTEFDIVTTCVASVTDDGITNERNHAWDDDSQCYCPACDWMGTVGQARIKNKKAKRL